MKAQCTATNRQGERCGKSPILGGTVCRMHGGAAPQVKAKAMERLMALQSPAIDALSSLLAQDQFPTVKYQAVRDVLDRTLGKPGESLKLAGNVTLTLEALVAKSMKDDEDHEE